VRRPTGGAFSGGVWLDDGWERGVGGLLGIGELGDKDIFVIRCCGGIEWFVVLIYLLFSLAEWAMCEAIKESARVICDNLNDCGRSWVRMLG
jgi:hypothetical protein